MSVEKQLVIVGAGPAGLSAGIYAARFGLDAVVLEAKVSGGQAAEAAVIENYPGFVSVRGMELMDVMRRQAEECGCVIHDLEPIKKIEKKGKKIRVVSERETYVADAVIVATGRVHTRLGVPGEERLSGRGVSYCATCDGPLFRGRRVLVVGGGNTACSEALYLSDVAREVHLVHRRDDLRAEAYYKRVLAEKGVKFHWNSEVKEIEGDKIVNRIRLVNNKTGEESSLDVDAVFIAVGYRPVSEIAKEAGVKMDEEGYIVVDREQKTSVEGIFAAGDVTGGVFQIATAVGEGAAAAVNAYLYIRGGWYGPSK
ncbi:MAG: thioredoxin-disulfide reductase [Candidatus Jordarchaeum sp.]|uniref:thioredoxin-disulfide reductase n=1 Tax=Candidatus Jordarchaeum sp. TaxID=2823881 RepID=UPI00404B1FB2